jgi:hypothetical protein
MCGKYGNFLKKKIRELYTTQFTKAAGRDNLKIKKILTFALIDTASVLCFCHGSLQKIKLRSATNLRSFDGI